MTVGIEGRCKQCDNLHNNEYLQKIVARFMNGIHKNTLLVYHGLGSLIDLIHWKTQRIDLLCFSYLSDFRKLVRKEGAIDI